MPQIAMAEPDLDKLLRRAIAERRVVTFALEGMKRIAEPHDYGLIDHQPRLLFYQLGGQSRSGRPIGWRWATPVSKISQFDVTDRHFAGRRPAPTGRHVKWDTLFASASPRDDET